jgi:hypothetical protein
LRNWALCLGYKTDEKIRNPPVSALLHDYHPFHNICRKDMQCGESTTEGFYANFSGDHISHDSPHDSFMRQVASRNGASCGSIPDRTAQRAPDVINLKLNHRQMHYRQGPFFNDFTMKTTSKVIKN